jgi:hypothetical protein
MSRSRRKNTVTTEEQNQGTVLTSEPINEAIEVRQAPQSEAEEPTTTSEPASEVDPVESMHPTSLAARWLLEEGSVLREMHRAVVRHIIFYTKPEGGGLSMQEAIARATKIIKGPAAENFYEFLTTRSVRGLTWLEIDRVFRYDPGAAQQFWEDLKEEADKDFKSGHFAAEIFEGSEWQQDPWRRAHFIAIRDSFIEQFNPQGGIDYSMIDMLAVTFTLWMHWTEKHMHRATTESCTTPSKSEREIIQQYKGEWIPPRVMEQEAIDHAAQMADRWRRAYQATLRQMRDWRRYNAPVTINNPQQVNIAAEGGQQVNLQKNKKSKK